MKIEVTTTYESAAYWGQKTYGAIFVKDKAHIPLVYLYLCQQDMDWQYYMKVIKVLPEYKTYNDLKMLCEYTGKTCIYDMVRFMRAMENDGVEVFVLQDNERMI